MGEVINFQKYLDKKNRLDCEIVEENYFIFHREFDNKWVAVDVETEEVIMSATHYDDLISLLKCNEMFDIGC